MIAFADFRDERSTSTPTCLPRRVVRREGGHRHAPRRPPPARAPGDRPRRASRARRWQVLAELCGALRRRPRRAGPAAPEHARWRGRCPSTPGLARRDRRPRRALAGARRGAARPPAEPRPSRSARGPAQPSPTACAWHRAELWAGRDRALALTALPRRRRSAPSCRRRRRALGVEPGDEVEVSVDGERARATALVRSGVPRAACSCHAGGTPPRSERAGGGRKACRSGGRCPESRRPWSRSSSRS